VTKNDMAQKIAKRMDMPHNQVLRIIQMALDNITEVLVTEGRLELRNFGVFEVKDRKPRKARNPKTGEKVMVPSRKAVTFAAGKFMQDRVNGLVGPVNSDAALDEKEVAAVDGGKA
jgi:nucleoid DNA-binding protein